MSVRTRSDSFVSEDESAKKPKLAQNHHETNLENLYLETIDRKNIDFSFEKVCCVTLSNINIYGCLVCGKYFQGRGKSSPAFSHSIDEDHHVFINFNNSKVYILPENKLVESSTLNDIKYEIFPTYSKSDISGKVQSSVDLNGNKFTPGFIGLNNIKKNDYSNVVLQALTHVKLIRDNLLLIAPNDELLLNNELKKRFIVFIKKLWSSKLFKNHISPHDLLQHIGVLSNKKFTINEQVDPKDFLLWLLNTLHSSFSSRDSKSTIFTKAFQGKLTIKSRKLVESSDIPDAYPEIDEKSTKFWILTLDLPPASLFKDGFGMNQVPQIKLSKLLEKYDGKKTHVLPGEIRTYEINKFPPFLIFHYNRFKDSNLQIQLNNKNRNQTIVEFPLTIDFNDGKVQYQLISNIVDEATQANDLKQDDTIAWKIQLRKHNDEWIEIENLNVKEREKEFLFLSETYIQVWERIK